MAGANHASAVVPDKNFIAGLGRSLERHASPRLRINRCPTERGLCLKLADACPKPRRRSSALRSRFDRRQNTRRQCEHWEHSRRGAPSVKSARHSQLNQLPLRRNPTAGAVIRVNRMTSDASRSAASAARSRAGRPFALLAKPTWRCAPVGLASVLQRPIFTSIHWALSMNVRYFS